MFSTIVIFDKNKNEQKINFLILPKIGETISYGHTDKKQYRVDNIVHEVNAITNQGEQLLNIYVSEKKV